MDEIWKPVHFPFYAPLYHVSNFGRVRRVDKGCILQGWLLQGYPRVGLRRDNKPITEAVHRLVAWAFIAPIPPDMTVNHKDGVKLNNHVENLEIITRLANIQHAHQVLHVNTVHQGSDHYLAKFVEADIVIIRHRYALGTSCSRMAKEYNVTLQAISLIVTRKNWKHVP